MSIYLILTIVLVYSILGILLVFASYFIFGHMIHVFKFTKIKEVKTSYVDFLLFFLPLISWILLFAALKDKTNKVLEISAIETIFVTFQFPIFWLIKLFVEPDRQAFSRILIVLISLITALVLVLYCPSFR